jgi:3-oxoacyl-[acyl-carrier protein] reductase
LEKILEGRTAIITGAGRGIGQAVALAFAQQGARLVLSARTSAEIEQAARACQDAGGEAHAIPADITSLPQVQRLVQSALSLLGEVDILVNSAGAYGPIGPTPEVDPAAWEQALRVNLLGPFYLCQALVPHMTARRQGKIILLGGGGATTPLPNLTAYAASKAGLARLADSLAEELQPFNVQVNVIAPGLVDTRLQDDVLAAGARAGVIYERILKARQTGEGTVPAEVGAALAVFLASPQSGTLTGKLISAPHDPWREWAGKGDELNRSSIYTIRRLDPFTIRPLIESLP